MLPGIGVKDDESSGVTEVRVDVDVPFLGELSMQKRLRGDARVAFKAIGGALLGVFAAIREEESHAGQEEG